MVAIVERAAAMGEPTHDDFVRCDDLLAIDTEVLPGFLRAARDNKAPRNEWRRISRPARLNRQARQIDILALPYDLLASRSAHFFRRHCKHLFDNWCKAAHCIGETSWRRRFFKEGKELADLAKRADIVFAHAQRDPQRRAEEVCEHGNVMTLRFLEEQRRSAGLQYAVAHFGHLELRVDFNRDALEFTAHFQLGNEIPEIAILHATVSAQ